MKKTASLMFLFGVVLSGCASPEVVYTQVKGADPDGAIKFKFAHSMLVTTAQLDKSNNVIGYAIHSVPVTAAKDPEYAIVGAPWYSNWGVETTLDATYIKGSTDLLKEVGVAVKDDRVTAIKDLGTIAATVASLAAEGRASKGPQHLPVPVDVTPFLGKKLSPHCKVDKNDRICTTRIDQYGWSFTIRISPLPKDKLDVKMLGNSYSSPAYLYSACRNAYVTLKWSKDGSSASSSDVVTIGKKTISLPTTTLQIADPHYLEAIAFPAAGKVDARGSCGAESTASDSKASSALDIVSALAKAAQTAKDAVDAKKSSKS